MCVPDSSWYPGARERHCHARCKWGCQAGFPSWRLSQSKRVLRSARERCGDSGLSEEAARMCQCLSFVLTSKSRMFSLLGFLTSHSPSQGEEPRDDVLGNELTAHVPTQHTHTNRHGHTCPFSTCGSRHRHRYAHTHTHIRTSYT